MADRICDCPACNRRYTDRERKPKFLSCHHNFCLECIKIMVAFSTIECPICQAITTVNGIDYDKALPTNQEKLYMMQHLLSAPRETLFCWDCNTLASDLCSNNRHTIIDTAKALSTNPRTNACQTNWTEAQTLRRNIQKQISRMKMSLGRFQSQLESLEAENNGKLISLQDELAKCKQIAYLMPAEHEKSLKDLDEAQRMVKKFVLIQPETKMAVSWCDKSTGNVIELNYKTTFENANAQLNQAITFNDVQNLVAFTVAISKRHDPPLKEHSRISPPPKPSKPQSGKSDDSVPGPKVIRPLIPPPSPAPNPPLMKSQSLDSSRSVPASRSVHNAPRHQLVNLGEGMQNRLAQLPQGKLFRQVSNASNPVPVSPLSPPLTPGPLSPEQKQPVNKALENRLAAEVRSRHYDLLADNGITLAWNPQHSTVATTSYSNDVVRILGYDSRIDQLNHSDDRAHRLAWNSWGTRLASGSIKGQIRLWTADGALLHTYSQENTILALKWSPDDKYLASGGLDETVCLWKMEDNTKFKTFRCESIIWDVDWQSPECFATASCDGTVHLCDIKSDVSIRRFRHENWVKAVRWNREGLILASCSTDKSVKVWTQFVDKPLQEFSCFNGPVNGIEWCPTNDRLLASCSDDGSIRLLDLNQAKTTLTINTSVRGSKVKCLAYSPDGKFLATGTDTGSLEVWDARSGAQMKIFTNWTDQIDKVGFDKSGDKVAVAVADEGCVIIEWRNSKKK